MTRNRSSTAAQSARWREVRRILEESLELPPGDRKQFVEDAAAGDDALRDEVLALLERSEASDERFETPVLARLARRDEQVAGSEPGFLGRYELLDRLGAGGMAEVYRGKLRGASGFEKDVAIKCIHPHFVDSSEARAMFEREAKLCADLQHANIVQVFDFVSDGDGYVLAMELIHGVSCDKLLSRLRKSGRTLPPECAGWIVSELLQGLEYAHTRSDKRDGSPLGIVHRDISPKNVMLSFEGAVKIIDFGIAKSKAHFGQTRTGVVRGTVQYMSPEQARGEAVDRRSDLFSAGALLFELLAGKKLFRGDTDAAILTQIASPERTVSENVRAVPLPKALASVVAKALAGAPEGRFAAASDFHAALLAEIPQAAVRGRAQLADLLRELFPDEISRLAQGHAAPSRAPRPEARRPRSRAPATLAVAGLVALTAAGGIFAWRELAGGAPSAVRPADAPAAAAPAAVAAPAPAPPAPVATGCRLAVASDPPGASILVDGALIGVTPLDVDVTCNRVVRIGLEKAGLLPVEKKLIVTERRGRLFQKLKGGGR